MTFNKLVLFAAILTVSPFSVIAQTEQRPLAWAYALNKADAQTPQDDGSLKSVPGSEQQFALTEIRNLYTPPDWHPEDHPVMPVVVAQGRNPEVYACAYCHLPNGMGRPENTSLAGLPVDYILQQMADYKAGLRVSSEPKLVPATGMLTVAMNATDEEIKAAAEYFSALRPKPWIEVIETDTVPKTEIAGWMHVAVEGGGREPLGQRIIEMPVDLERTELRDDRSGFIAYVPTGSIEQGKQLATTCRTCHGDDLRGLGPVPALAGRSPSYMVRQLNDFRTGARKGLWSPLMLKAIADLSTDDFIALAAYSSSLTP